LHEAFDYAARKGRPVYFNLGAKKWVNRYSKEIELLLPTIEGIIGNTEEVIELNQQITNTKTTIEESIENICKYKHKSKRFIVVTNSSEPTLLGELQGDKVRIEELNTPRIENIKNTSGAGDALAGGLLGGIISGFSLIDSLKVGQKLACHHIQQTDGSLPPTIL